MFGRNLQRFPTGKPTNSLCYPYRAHGSTRDSWEDVKKLAQVLDVRISDFLVCRNPRLRFEFGVFQ